MLSKIRTVALASFISSMALTAQAQSPVKFGIKTGINVSNFRFSQSVFNRSNRTGWFAGPTVKFSLPFGLGLDASVLYDYRSAKFDAFGDVQTVRQEQLAVPVNLRSSIGLGSLASIFFFAGPQVAFNVGDKDYHWTRGSSYSLKKSNFSVNLGFGITVIRHLQLSANYNIACGKTGETTWVDVTSAVGSTLAQNQWNARNNSWQLGLAYFF